MPQESSSLTIPHQESDGLTVALDSKYRSFIPSKTHFSILIENIFGISAEVFKDLMTSPDPKFSELSLCGSYQPARSNSKMLAELWVEEEDAKEQLLPSDVQGEYLERLILWLALR